MLGWYDIMSIRMNGRQITMKTMTFLKNKWAPKTDWLYCNKHLVETFHFNNIDLYVISPVRKFFIKLTNNFPASTNNIYLSRTKHNKEIQQHKTCNQSPYNKPHHENKYICFFKPELWMKWKVQRRASTQTFFVNGRLGGL